MSLRVGVTGPTGEIGLATIAALEEHPDVDQIVGMARRAFDPARTAGRRRRTGRATSSTATPSTRWSPTPTWWSISRSSSWDRGRTAPGSTWPAPATSSRRPSAADRAQAAGLHLIGRRLRLSLRQSRPDHRGRAGPRIRRALLLRAEGGVRGGAGRDSPRLRRWRSTCCGRASSRVRRRRHWPTPCRGTGCPGRCAASPGRCRCPNHRSPTPAPHCNSSTTTTSPRRSPWRRPPRRRRLAPTTSPATGW